MKKFLLALFVLSSLAPAFCFAQKGKIVKTYDLLIGAYTRPNGSKGIYVYRFDTETGKVTYLSELDNVSNPSYLAVSNDNKFVYAVNEESRGTGFVSSFKFDAATGKLDSLNKLPTAGGPAYISVDKGRKNVFVADYNGGNLLVFPINKDGSLGASSQKIQDEGGSVDKSRQAGPHVHTAVLSPDEKYLLYTDLGTDKINIYQYKASKNPPLTQAPESFVNAIPGNGPRHLVFSNNGKYLYNIQEMGGAITAYTYDDGKLKAFQTVKMAADGFTGRNAGADIHISPDGLFLYGTNRGTANELLAYSINQQNGELTHVARYPTGKEPRNFTIEPGGNFLLLASQNSNSVAIFKIDKATGKLTQDPATITIAAPVCLKLVPVE
jgi:6-phosphogluconolactonase